MIANTFIKPSKIHGLGLFALHFIKKDEQIWQGVANFEDYIPEWLAYIKTTKERSFNYHQGYCMVNHSETPNLYRGQRMRMYAARDILKGEEITEDYNKLDDEQNPFKDTNRLEEIIWRIKNKL